MYITFKWFVFCCFQQLLKEEIGILKDKVDHHPDVSRFAIENLELRGVYLGCIACSELIKLIKIRHIINFSRTGSTTCKTLEKRIRAVVLGVNPS